jgi:NAD(P)-dependent dehydrogenase (short-subunit alcohol dehydrogenase family)
MLGCNSGIGYETALQLAKQGAQIVLACRNESYAKEAMDKIKKIVKDAKLMFIKLDLSDLQSVKEFVTEFEKTKLPIHFLINNAGIRK